MGEAFTQSWALIPLFGISVQSALESGDRVLEKVSQKRRRIIEKIRPSVPSLADFLDFVIFDPDYQGDPEQDAKAWKERLSTISKNVGDKMTELKNQSATQEGRDALMSTAKTGIADLASHPVLQSAKEKFNDTKDNLLRNYEKAKGGPETQSLIPKGGKRLSDKKHKKSKWKTQRKLKM